MIYELTAEKTPLCAFQDLLATFVTSVGANRGTMW